MKMDESSPSQYPIRAGQETPEAAKRQYRSSIRHPWIANQSEFWYLVTIPNHHSPVYYEKSNPMAFFPADVVFPLHSLHLSSDWYGITGVDSKYASNFNKNADATCFASVPAVMKPLLEHLYGKTWNIPRQYDKGTSPTNEGPIERFILDYLTVVYSIGFTIAVNARWIYFGFQYHPIIFFFFLIGLFGCGFICYQIYKFQKNTNFQLILNEQPSYRYLKYFFTYFTPSIYFLFCFVSLDLWVWIHLQMEWCVCFNNCFSLLFFMYVPWFVLIYKAKQIN
jgi:hypothetical protein